MNDGITLIAVERAKQKIKYPQEHDKFINNHYQLSQAANLLLWIGEEDFGWELEACCPIDWNVDIWKKLMTKSYKERLIIAGALIAAEIDRIG